MRHFNASDAISWQVCKRRAWYDVQPGAEPLAPDPFDRLTMRQGMEHEARVLDALGDHQRAASAQHTAQLMAQQVPVIYQPRIEREDLQLVAQPDFLLLEEGGYRIADAKSARSIARKKDIQLQLAAYQKAFDLPLAARAYLPQGATEDIGEQALADVEVFLDGMRDFVNGAERPSAHYVASKCGACPHRSVCVPEFERAGDLGQNYFVDARSIAKLQAQGIHTIADLAARAVETIADVPWLKGDRKAMAVAQAQSLIDNRIVPLAPYEPLPTPVVHFDIEAYPMAREDGKGEVYLWGFLPPPFGRDDFEYVFSDGGADNDRRAWDAFLAQVAGYRARFEGVRLVHYARYEADQIRLYAERFDTRDDPTVTWLLGEGLIDLCAALKRSVILPVKGYGLKQVCKHPDLVDFQWELAESGSQWSVVRYADYLACDDNAERAQIKAEILAYNRDDVRATRALELWLEDLPGEVG